MTITRAPRGVTLIEAAIVLAIVAIVASAAMPSFGAFIETRRLDGAATQLAADVRAARAEAIQRGSGVRLTLHHASWGDCYVVHTGGADQCRCDEDGAASCIGDAQALETVRRPTPGRLPHHAKV